MKWKFVLPVLVLSISISSVYAQVTVLSPFACEPGLNSPDGRCIYSCDEEGQNNTLVKCCNLGVFIDGKENLLCHEDREDIKLRSNVQGLYTIIASLIIVILIMIIFWGLKHRRAI